MHKQFSSFPTAQKTKLNFADRSSFSSQSHTTDTLQEKEKYLGKAKCNKTLFGIRSFISKMDLTLENQEFGANV